MQKLFELSGNCWSKNSIINNYTANSKQINHTKNSIWLWPANQRFNSTVDQHKLLYNVNKSRNVRFARKQVRMETIDKAINPDDRIDQINHRFYSEKGIKQMQQVASAHYIYEHLFGNFRFKPECLLNITYPSCQIYFGNNIKPKNAYTTPTEISLSSCLDKELLKKYKYTLMMLDLDGNLFDFKKYLYHWIVSDISICEKPVDDSISTSNKNVDSKSSDKHDKVTDNKHYGQSKLVLDFENGNEQLSYLPPIPYENTGLHRVVYLLLRQLDDKADYSLKIEDELEFRFDHSFKNFRNQNKYGYVSFGWFQSSRDLTVPQTCKRFLGIKEPVFELLPKLTQDQVKHDHHKNMSSDLSKTMQLPDYDHLQSRDTSFPYLSENFETDFDDQNQTN